MSTIADRPTLSDLQQFGTARAATPDDAIDGVAPGAVVEPSTPEDAAAVLARASAAGMVTVLRGGGTKLGWGRVPRSIELLVGMTHLDRLVAHRHGDLTATVQAGARLQELNAQLAAQGQWLPIDSAFDGATIGGIVATNDSGPLRTRYGTPRDLLIGITLALTDGRLVKAGGHVVKNVAGYDLGKLMSGSFGELAAIVDATFKLLPIPATSQTIEARYTNAAALAEDVARLSASQLEPTAFDIHVRLSPGEEVSRTLLVRFATSPEATAAQVGEAGRLMTGGATEVLAAAADGPVWSDQVARPWSERGVVVRMSWLPAALPRVLGLLDEVRRLCSGAVELSARVPVGAGFVRLEGSDDEIERAAQRLRSSGAVVSNVVMLNPSTALKGRVDPWGPPVSASGVLRALKKSFDPAGILNAGRGPV